MTRPSDSSADTALPQEVFHNHLQGSPTLDARLHRDIMRYYSSKCKMQIMQAHLRAEYPNPDDAPDFVQEALRAEYPTLAQYLAYLSRLNAASASPQSADKPSPANSPDLS